MRPRKLKIVGLNSFEEEVIIDFNELTKKGLFGIFGPTGSGKSTILDAITIALYGKVARGNKGYINTNTKNLNVKYEFEISLSKDERKIYIAERNMRIDKHGAYKTRYARLIEKDENENNVIAEGPKEVQKCIESIIGLTAEDFTRSVVLPQGKFSEFLSLTGKQKRDMLERIFALEKYGKNLMQNIKKARDKELKEKNILFGEMKKYEGISQEIFLEKKLELKNLINEEKELNEEKKNIDKDYEKYKIIYEFQKEFQYYKKMKCELKDKSGEISNQKEMLSKGRKANSVKPLIDDKNNTKKDSEKLKFELKNLEEKLKTIDEKLKNAQEEYNKIFEIKENDIPKLVKKETNLIQAIKIKEKISKFKLEREKLRESYSSLKKENDNASEKLKSVLESIERTSKNIEEAENRLKNINIEPEYREKVQYAFEKEKECTNLSKQNKELSLKIKNKENNVITLDKKHKCMMQEQSNKEKIIMDLKNKLEKIEDEKPKDESEIIEKSQEIALFKERLNKLKDSKMKKEKFLESLNVISCDEDNIQKDLNNMKETLNLKEKNLKNIKEEIDKINKNNLAEILRENLKEGKPCPVCGAIHHEVSNVKIDKVSLEKKEKEKTNLEENIKELNESINAFSIKLVSIQKEKEHVLYELNVIEEDVKGVNLNDLKRELDVKEEEIIFFKNALKKYKEEKSLFEKSIDLEREKKSKIDIEEVRTYEMLKNEREAIDELKKELQKEEEELNKMIFKCASLKNEINIESVAKEIEKIKKAEKESRVLQNKEKENRDLLNKMSKQKDELNERIGNLQVEISKILQSGKEKSFVIKSDEEEIARLTSGENPEEGIKKVRKSIKEINEKSEELKNILEKNKEEKQKSWDYKLSLEERNIILSKNLEEEEEKLKKSLKENEFKCEEEVIKSLLNESTLKVMEQDIKEYEDKVKNVENNLNRIEKKLNGEFIEEDTWNSIQKSRIEKEKLLNIKIKEIATLEKSVNDMERYIEELKKLKIRESKIEHKLSLLNDIGKLVEGNKFVQFVAMNELKYIAMEASRRLKSITRERYALQIDSEGNFTIRDDFGGGEVRDTSTLSGGETFLTSLALALALSSQIQLKGSVPLEFFFLDEGFGTLDSELLDIVMNSLEKIHNNTLSIGIISHVEELKNRVPIKLIVTPAKQGEGGSKVKMEYS